MRFTSYKISGLHLDTHNPRMGRGVETEAEAFVALLERHGDTIRGLARDIAAHGLNPLEEWAVVNEGGKRVVLEGNRRLAACRLLLDPSRAPTQQDQRYYSGLRLAVPRARIERTRAVLFDRRADARHWIELKHHGLGSGEGLHPWGPEMVYLDRVNNGGTPEAWNEFWYWLEETYSQDADMAALIRAAREYQYTGMERVYHAGLPKLIGARLEGKRLSVEVSPERLREFVRELMTEMGRDGSINSRSMNTGEQASGLIEAMYQRTLSPGPELSGPSADVPSNEEKSGRPAEASHPKTGKKGLAAPAPTQSRTAPRTASTRPTRAETNLYAGIAALSRLPGRLKNLLAETQAIRIAKNPEIAGIMARVALELTLDALIDKEQLPLKQSKPSLFDKAKAVLSFLDPKYDQKSPGVPRLSGVWSAIRRDQQESGHLLKDLNDCVHNYEFTASEDVARRANNVLTPLMVDVVEKLRRK